MDSERMTDEGKRGVDSFEIIALVCFGIGATTTGQEIVGTAISF